MVVRRKWARTDRWQRGVYLGCGWPSDADGKCVAGVVRSRREDGVGFVGRVSCVLAEREIAGNVYGELERQHGDSVDGEQMGLFQGEDDRRSAGSFRLDACGGMDAAGVVSIVRDCKYGQRLQYVRDVPGNQW